MTSFAGSFCEPLRRRDPANLPRVRSEPSANPARVRREPSKGPTATNPGSANLRRTLVFSLPTKSREGVRRRVSKARPIPIEFGGLSGGILPKKGPSAKASCEPRWLPRIPEAICFFSARTKHAFISQPETGISAQDAKNNFSQPLKLSLSFSEPRAPSCLPKNCAATICPIGSLEYCQTCPKRPKTAFPSFKSLNRQSRMVAKPGLPSLRNL